MVAMATIFATFFMKLHKIKFFSSIKMLYKFGKDRWKIVDVIRLSFWTDRWTERQSDGLTLTVSISPFNVLTGITKMTWGETCFVQTFWRERCCPQLCRCLLPHINQFIPVRCLTPPAPQAVIVCTNGGCKLGTNEHADVSS